MRGVSTNLQHLMLVIVADAKQLQHQPPSAGNSRPLKQTYAVAGQQKCPKHEEKTDCCPLDLTNSSTIPRAMKWTRFNKLDQINKPGLSKTELWGLVRVSPSCTPVWVQTDSGCRDLRNILTAILSWTTSDPSWEASA
jgi:hypothetical protein